MEILFFLFGAALGSFVNVVVTRLHVAPIMKGRSKCLSCGSQISWYDLIPVVSYLVLQGRCRSCKHRFGKEHLLVEMFYGAVFVCVYLFILQGFPVMSGMWLWWLVVYSLLFVTLGVLSLYDLRHKMIPFAWYLALLAVSAGVLAMRVVQGDPLVTLAAPFLVALPFLGVYLITKGRALGFADILMYIAVGAFFGIAQGIAVLFVSVWIGAVVGVVLHLLKKDRYSFSSGIPFIPFIALAWIVVLFTDMDIFSIVSLFA